jgi:hypothetical protein
MIITQDLGFEFRENGHVEFLFGQVERYWEPDADAGNFYGRMLSR